LANHLAESTDLYAMPTALLSILMRWVLHPHASQQPPATSRPTTHPHYAALRVAGVRVD